MDQLQNSIRRCKCAQTPFDLLEPKTTEFYLRGLDLIAETKIPFAIGGAYALGYYSGIIRHTKDLDVFAEKCNAPHILAAFENAGYRTAWTHPHWIAKAFSPDDEDYIDIIYGSGNGLTPVDDEWLACSLDGEILGRKVKICPVEEILWSKCFIQERDRFDGADVAHLLLTRMQHLDWRRLLRRFTGHEAVLLSHLFLFGYIYPNHRDRIPAQVMTELLAAAQNAPKSAEKLCRGPVLSFSQYLVDVNEWGYKDARLSPHGPLSAEQIERWTNAPK